MMKVLINGGGCQAGEGGGEFRSFQVIFSFFCPVIKIQTLNIFA
jgi:hypothetical protein